jgi:hypothetical protein
MPNLTRLYRDHDKAREKFRKAELALKQGVALYAKSQGLLVTPRPETLRATLQN